MTDFKNFQILVILEFQSFQILSYFVYKVPKLIKS